MTNTHVMFNEASFSFPNESDTQSGNVVPAPTSIMLPGILLVPASFPCVKEFSFDLPQPKLQDKGVPTIVLVQSMSSTN